MVVAPAPASGTNTTPRLRCVFNLQGSELVIILLLALVVLGPEKLPDAMRKAGQFYAELKKMSSGFQAEFRAVVDEPLRELKDTANTIRDSADFTKLQNGERPEKPKSADMVAAADPDVSPSENLPFAPERDDPASGDVESDGAEEVATDEPPTPAPFSGAQQSSAAPRTEPEPAKPFSGAQQSSAAPRTGSQPPPPKPFSSSHDVSPTPAPEPEPIEDPIELADAGDLPVEEDAE